MTRRAQTATEYLTLLAVVIIIALVVVGVLGGIPGFGSGVSEQTARATLSSQKIAILDYGVSDYDTVFTLQNQHTSFIEIDAITFNGVECTFFYNKKPKLGIGKSKQITCTDVLELDESTVSWPVVINWTDTKTGAEYSQSGDDLVLVGSIGSKYMATLQANAYWDASIDGCWQSTNLNPNPICTCLDLNKTRTQVTWNYTLQNSIDFNRCEDFFGDMGWTSGTGWLPIASLTGVFDGDEKIISNLFVNRPSTNNIGLIATGSPLIHNTGVVNVDITGDTYVGSLVGYNNFGSITNSYSSGSVDGTKMAGGLAGAIAGSGIAVSNSFSSATVNSTTYSAGGLIGYSTAGLFTNNYAEGRVYAPSAGGLIGNVAGATCTGTNTWVNHAGDDATSCTGAGTCSGCTP